MSKEDLLEQWVNDPHKMIKKAMNGYCVIDVNFITSDGHPDSDIEAVKIELYNSLLDETKTITFMAGDAILNFMINPADPDGRVLERMTSYVK